LLGYLSSGSLGNNLLLNFGVSPKEIFQRNMTWFLIGEIIIIVLVLSWRYRRKKKKQLSSEKEL
jgi:preprotein translocase subunit SecG